MTDHHPSDPSIRPQTPLQVARIETPDDEELCIVRTMSRRGALIQTYCGISVHMPVTLVFKSGEVVTGRVLWVDGDEAGLTFTDLVDVDIVAATCGMPALVRARTPRIFESGPALLSLRDRDMTGEVRDISPGGIKISLAEMPKPGDQAQVSLEGLGTRQATACWSSNGETGFAFTPPLSYSEFAKWRRRDKGAMQRGI